MARGISVEKLAAEMRINSRYLEALESNDYDRLPGDAYIRVYLRSICVYFSLNPEEVLQRFFDERGLTGVDTLRKDSSTKINLETVQDKKTPGALLFVGIALIVVLAGSAFFAGRQGWFNQQPAGIAGGDTTQQAYSGDTTDYVPELSDLIDLEDPPARRKPANASAPAGKGEKSPALPGDTAKPQKSAVPSTVDSSPAKRKTVDSMAAQSARDTLKKATAAKAMAALKDTGKTVAAALKPSLEKQEKDTVTSPQAPVSTGKTMKLRITVVNDSCWARVFSDNKEWRKLLRKGATMSWIARDSFNVHIGANQTVSISLDEKPVIVPGSGVVTFKIDQMGNVTPWTIAKWNTVFQDRR